MKKSFKKALALVLSFMLSVTCFAAVPFAALADVVVTPDSNVDPSLTHPTVTANYDTQLRFTNFTCSEFATRKDNNLVKKASVAAYKSDGNICPDVNSNNGIACLTDGYICENGFQSGEAVPENAEGEAPDGAKYGEATSGLYNDGKFSGKYYAYQGFNLNKGTADGATLEIALAKPTEITNIYLLGSCKLSGTFQKYDVYVSDRKSTLYDEKNLVLSYDGTASLASYKLNRLNADNEHNQGKNGPGNSEGQEYTFNGEKKPTGSFIGFKISQLCTAAEDFFYLCELGVEGKEGESNASCDNVDATVWSAYKTSVHIGFADSETYYDSAKANNLLAKAEATALMEVLNTTTNLWGGADEKGNGTSGGKQGILFDGVVEKQGDNTSKRWRVYSNNPNKVTVDLGNAYAISKFYFSGAMSNPLQMYSLYASDKLSELYNTENEILNFSYSGRNMNDNGGFCPVDEYSYSDTVKPTARYFGIYAPQGSSGGAVMYTELGFEGTFDHKVEAEAKDIDIDYISDKMHYVDVASGAQIKLDDIIGDDWEGNDLTERNVTKSATISHNAYTLETDTRNNFGAPTDEQFAGITDGLLGDNAEKYNPTTLFGDKLSAKTCKDYGDGSYSWITEHKYAYEFVIALNDFTSIQAIVLGSAASNPIGDHDIFVAANQDDLFKGTPIASYVMDTDKWIVSRDSAHPASALGVNLWKTNENAQIIGKYVGIRVWIGDAMARTSSALAQYYFDRMRTNEFAVYGDEVEVFEPTLDVSNAVKVVPSQDICVKGKSYSFTIEKLVDEAVVSEVKYGEDPLTDNEGVYTITDTSGEAKTITVTTEKNAQDKATAPTLDSKTASSIKLVAEDGYEYKIGDDSWQSSSEFTGLEAVTEYSFYRRLAATDSLYAGAASDEFKATTDKNAAPAAPEAPVLASKDAYSIVVSTTAGNEYSLDGINWQVSGEFTGLNAYTDYDVYARIAETTDTYASAVSPALTVKTDCDHADTKIVGEVKATCTKAGYTGDKVCATCGTPLETGKAVKALGHKTTIKTTKATYFADGKKETKCTVCGKTLKTETIKKLTLKTPTVKVTAKKKALSIKVGKVTGQTGFQIKYRLKGKKWTTKTFTTKKAATKTIKKLKAKKSYQVQVRAMVKSGSKKAYSAWSKVITKKTK